jgi:DNA-binding IclR family transcriptional regulator
MKTGFSMKKKSKRRSTNQRATFTENKDFEYSSVQKAIGILLSFIPDNKAIGNLELSKSLGLNKSTVSRLTHVLAHYGLVQQDEKTLKYELGRTAALLGMAVEASHGERLAQIGRPYVDYLRDTVGESACLEVLVPEGIVRVVCVAVGPPPLSVTFPESIPMHVAASAKVILAFSDHEFTDSIINGDFTRITDNTITDSEVFKAQLEEVRRRGVAYDHGEASAYVHTASVPVFDARKKPIAALSICVPSNRVHKITDPNNIEVLKKTAMLISGRLFYEAPKK